MKLILIPSIIGMVAAGVYGGIDMYTDVCSGTMIRYNEGQPQQTSETKKTAGQKQKLADKIKPELKQPVQQKASIDSSEFKVASKVKKIEWFSEEIYSRGDPEIYLRPVDEVVLPAPEQTDSTAIVSASTETVSDTLSPKE